jgi:hypothetical protein
MGWTIGVRNPNGVFRHLFISDLRPIHPPVKLVQVFFLGSKAAGALSLFTAEVKGRAEIYFYSLSVLLCRVIERT